MSDWGAPTLSPPEYLGHRVGTNSEAELEYYSSELGLSNNLKRITSDLVSSKRVNGEFLSTKTSSSFVDPPIVRSEAWSSCDFVKSSKKRRWIKFKSDLKSCLKSVKCRFTALGLLLGVALSLAALIPVVIVWQTSKSASNSTSFLSATGAGSSLNVSTFIPANNPTFVDEQVIFTTNMTIIALSLVVIVQRTENGTYWNTYNSYNSVINSTYTTTNTQIIYTFFIQDPQVLLASTYTCGVQFILPNVNHTTSIDGYSIQTTNICGVINTASGNFQ